jgi:hypothetical protein
MKRKLINLFLLLSLVAIAFLILKPAEHQPVSEQQMENIAQAISDEFSRAASQQAKRAATQPRVASNTSSNQPNVGNQQSIIGAIYKKTNTTWFFKAKASADKINSISPTFKNYFVDQLKFDQDEQPILSHIPESMRAANTSSMRVATFRIAGVEVSVTQLSGNQDVYANVQRWMKQIGLTDIEKIQLDFKDNKNTILVKMPK